MSVEPAGDEGDPDHDAIVEPERVEHGRDADQAEDGDDPDAAASRCRPTARGRAAIAGASGEREHREDEADQGGIDAEGLRDTRADPRDDPIVGATGEGAKCHWRSW